jgi:hypothetical protein
MVLLNDTVSNSDYGVSNGNILINDELERMWKKAVVAYFKVLSRYYRAGTENKQ